MTTNNEDTLEPDDAEETDIVVSASPLDTSKIDIAVETRSLYPLIQRMKHGEIDMNTDFQRDPNLWSPLHMSRLIESILIGLPLPGLYFDIKDKDSWQIVDGLQRLSSIYRFVIEKEIPLDENDPKTPLKLKNLEFLKNLEGKTYDDLERKYHRRIEDFQITCFLIRKGTPSEVKYSIFRRINTGGKPLYNQEIRNALATESERHFLRQLTQNEIFKQLTGKLTRMRDQELILRFFAFYWFDYLEPDNVKQLALFLDRAMEKLKKSDEEKRAQDSAVFIKTINRCADLLGKDGFKKPDNSRKNASLFEIWTVALAKLSKNNFETILEKKELFQSKVKALFLDDAFLRSITSATSSAEKVRLRHDRIATLLEEVLND